MQQLAQRLVEKPWGVRGIPPRFGASSDERIGEIWFEPPTGQTLDVMVKYLFTTERLSIQVHPDEVTAHARGLAYGKDECWIVLDAAPGSEIGIGTRERVTPDALIAATKDGSIEELIDWRPAVTGQFLYNPARTVHALGAGLTLLEVQQASDVTYRLYDYGRPRPLHLDDSRDVVDPRPHHHPADTAIDAAASRVLVDGPFFGVAWCHGTAPDLPPHACDVQLLPIDADVKIDGGVLAPGQCALLDGDVAALRSTGAFVLAWSR